MVYYTLLSELDGIRRKQCVAFLMNIDTQCLVQVYIMYIISSNI